MIESKTVYFEKHGPDNTAATLAAAVAACRELGIKKLVMASSTGRTPLMLTGAEGLDVTVVTSAYGQTEPGANPMSAETRAELLARGYHVVTAAHALSGAERSMSTTFGGVYPAELIAHTLRMIGSGTKVAVEVAAMAADAGYVTGGETVVAIGGTSGGADTAVVLRPEVSAKLLKTKVERFLCKPLD